MDDALPEATSPRPTRRERQRLAALQEIKDAALTELRSHGPSGVTLRAVARAIDLTPSGLYRYVPDHTSLLAELCVDALETVRAELVRAHDACDPDDLAGQWLAGSLAARRWALDHRAEYSLVYGTPPSGLRPMPSAVAGAHRRVSELPVLIALRASANGQLDLERATMEVSPGSIRAGAISPAAPSRLVAVSASACASIIGLVSLELFGHLDGVVEDRDAYYLAHNRALMTAMGFTAVPATAPPRPA